MENVMKNGNACSACKGAILGENRQSIYTIDTVCKDHLNHLFLILRDTAWKIEQQCSIVGSILEEHGIKNKTVVEYIHSMAQQTKSSTEEVNKAFDNLLKRIPTLTLQQ